MSEWTRDQKIALCSLIVGIIAVITTIALALGNRKDEESEQPVNSQAVYIEKAALKFFQVDSTAPAKEQREYKTRFAKSTLRYIQWELELNYSSLKQQKEFSGNITWYRPDGSTFWQESLSGRLSQGTLNTIHSRGCGWSEPGYWASGTYKVEGLIKGEGIQTKTISETFQIY